MFGMPKPTKGCTAREEEEDINIQFVPHVELYVLRLERPGLECCVGK
jgi:hypothetical protein